MENDVLKNKIAPWQEKGRWYHGVLNKYYNGFETAETDQFLIDNFGIGVNGGYSYLRETSADHKYNILDMKFRYVTFKPASALLFTSMLYLYSDGRVGYFTGGINTGSGKVEFWAFIADNAN